MKNIGYSVKNIIVIPARMDSKRLPGKPMADVNGRPLVEWTYRAAMRAGADIVTVATPDEEIASHCFTYSIPHVLSREDAPNGTVRCKQAIDRMMDAGSISIKKPNRVINWQVDEPLVDPTYVHRMLHTARCEIITLVSVKGDNSANKVVINDKWEQCHWFSRNEIPGAAYHCGVYCFDWEALREVSLLTPSKKARLESLEQLTWLENYWGITPIPMHKLPLSIDTQEDLDVFRKMTK